MNQKTTIKHKRFHLRRFNTRWNFSLWLY